MTTPATPKNLSDEQVMRALNGLGEDPSAERVAQVQAEIFPGALPDGASDETIRATVDLVRRQLDSGTPRTDLALLAGAFRFTQQMTEPLPRDADVLAAFWGNDVVDAIARNDGNQIGFVRDASVWGETVLAAALKDILNAADNGMAYDRHELGGAAFSDALLVSRRKAADWETLAARYAPRLAHAVTYNTAKQFLLGYAPTSRVSEVYDESPKFAQTLQTIYGKQFAYADYANLTIRELMANIGAREREAQADMPLTQPVAPRPTVALTDVVESMRYLLGQARELKDMKEEINGDYSDEDLAVWDAQLDEAERAIDSLAAGRLGMTVAPDASADAEARVVQLRDALSGLESATAAASSKAAMTARDVASDAYRNSLTPAEKQRVVEAGLKFQREAPANSFIHGVDLQGSYEVVVQTFGTSLIHEVFADMKEEAKQRAHAAAAALPDL